MTITSSAFQNNEPIPDKYSFDGENVNPPLTFSEVAIEAKSLALVMEDPDAPSGTFTHWILYNMSPATLQVMEGQKPETGQVGTNDFGTQGYGGPKPPSGMHRYFFKLFALDTELAAKASPQRADVYTAMEGHVIDTAELVGLYSHKE